MFKENNLPNHIKKGKAIVFQPISLQSVRIKFSPTTFEYDYINKFEMAYARS